MDYKLKGVEWGEKSVKVTYIEGDSTEVIKTMPHAEYDRMLGMMIQAGKSKTSVISEEASAPSIAEEILKVRKDLNENFEKKFSVLECDSKLLFKFIHDVKQQRDNIWDKLSQDTSESIQKLYETITKVNTVQQESLAMIATREDTIAKIVSDIEKREQWTWESARQITAEVRKSVSEQAAFKVEVSNRVGLLMAEIDNKVRGLEGLKSKALEEHSLFVKKSELKIEQLVRDQQRALADQKKFLDESRVNEFKATYLEEEILRRTALDRDKATFIVDLFEVTERNLNDRFEEIKQDLADTCDQILDDLTVIDRAYLEADQVIPEILTEMTAKLELSNKEFAEYDADFAKHCLSAEKISDFISKFIKLLETDVAAAIDLVNAAERSSNLVSFVADEVQKLQTSTKLFEDEVVAPSEKVSGWAKFLKFFGA